MEYWSILGDEYYEFAKEQVNETMKMGQYFAKEVSGKLNSERI